MYFRKLYYSIKYEIKGSREFNYNLKNTLSLARSVTLKWFMVKGKTCDL